MIRIFIHLIISFSLFAQSDIEKQFFYAKELFQNENYFDAVTELKRLIFFDSAGTYRKDAFELAGLSFKHGGQYSDAVKYLTMAELNSTEREDLFRIRVHIIRVNILRRAFDSALRQISRIESGSVSQEQAEELIYWRGWVHMLAGEWDKAAESFYKIQPDHLLGKKSEQTHREMYSVTAAIVLSTFIPGAGQFYTGEYVSGLLSLGWNILFGYLTVKAFTEDRVFDGIITANFLWLRFYTGNRQNAEKFAIEKNLEISNKTLNWLNTEYTGLKP